jgi:hypothetical protein
MSTKNYHRIAKGYEPIEPVAFFEKVFYVLWSVMCAFRILAMCIRLRVAKEQNSTGRKAG